MFSGYPVNEPARLPKTGSTERFKAVHDGELQRKSHSTLLFSVKNHHAKWKGKPDSSKGWLAMIGLLKNVFQLLKKTFFAWINGSAQKMAAAISFYTIFSMVPLFMIALAIAGFCFGADAARRELFSRLAGLIGESAAQSVESMVTLAAQHQTSGTLATLVAASTLLIGASGLFIELQTALDSVSNVKHVEEWGVMAFLKTRLLSFAMVLGIGFLFLVSLIASLAISALGNLLGGLFSGQELFLNSVNFLLSLVLVTVLFALIYKILPDVVVRWRAVAVGGFIAAVLFNAGKILLGFYLTHSNIATLYGAPGSLMVILLWVYYSSQILFFGAEATGAYAALFGARLQPAKGSRRVTQAKIKLPPHPRKK
jgi:membrane protein